MAFTAPHRIFITPNSEKFLYRGNFNLNEKIIKENNLIDLQNFSDYSINVKNSLVLKARRR